MHFAQSVGLSHSLMYILREISQLALDLGNNDEARGWLQQGLKLSTETSFRRLEGFFRVALGVVARRGRSFDEARQQFETGMALFRESSEPRGVTLCLQYMGDLAVDEQRLADAERFYRESLSQSEAIDFRLGVASALCSLGVAVAVNRQQHRLAREHFERALSVATDIGATPVSIGVLVGLASLAPAEESSREQTAEWLAQVLVHPAGKHDTKEKARALLDELATEMGQERVDEAVRRGEARELDEILAEAVAG